MVLNCKLLLLLLLISAETNGQGNHKKHDFAIVVGSCFEKDTITIKINGQNVIENAIVSSDFSTGITGISVYQDRNGLVGNWPNNRIEKDRLAITKTISIELTINSVTKVTKLDLKKGKNIIIDKCKVSITHGTAPHVVTFRQFKKQMVFE